MKSFCFNLYSVEKENTSELDFMFRLPYFFSTVVFIEARGLKSAFPLGILGVFFTLVKNLNCLVFGVPCLLWSNLKFFEEVADLFKIVRGRNPFS